MGAPGGGKGTISKKIISDFNFVHVSTGDLLRSQVAMGTPLGLQAQGFMNAGALVPDEVIVGMVKSQNKGNASLLLDGRVFL